jgi:hypothetical protein
VVEVLALIGDTVVGVAHVGPGERVTIGPAPGADFASLEPEVLIDSPRDPVRCRAITRGIQTFVIREAGAPGPVLPRGGSGDARFARYLGVSAIAVFAALAIAGSLPEVASPRPLEVRAVPEPPPPIVEARVKSLATPACVEEASRGSGSPPPRRRAARPAAPRPVPARSSILDELPAYIGDGDTLDLGDGGDDAGRERLERTPGTGGGGTGWGTIAAGDYGVTGEATGTGRGYCGLTCGSREAPREIPEVRAGSIRSVGSLDKHIIARYVRRRYGQLRRCYEATLERRPDAAGQVVAHFQILSTGQVRLIGSTGFDRGLERCVSGVIGSMSFPPASGGGFVTVHYPFTFRMARP